MKKLLPLLIAIGLQSHADEVSPFGEAQWIGGTDQDMALYPQHLTVYRLSWTDDGDGWVKFGIGDERFTNKYLNQWHIANDPDSVYELVETDARKGSLTISRHGMDQDGSQEITLPAEALKSPGRHKIDIGVAYGTAEVAVDGNKIGMANLNPARGAIDKSLWLTGDFTSYPCLGQVEHGGGVDDLQLRHYRSPGNIIAQGRFEPKSPLQLRTQFDSDKEIAKATLTMTARGIYDAYINGQPVRPDWYFCPGFTQYDATQLYQTYDVTDLLSTGNNIIEVALSEGWWSGPSTYSAQNWNYYGDRQSLLARLEVKYADGTMQEIFTNPDTWQCNSDGARLQASLFNGEVVDGRRPLFAPDSQWHRPCVITTQGTMPESADYSRVEYIEQRDMPVHPIDTLTALSWSEVRPQVYVYDMGQNIAGVPLIDFSGQPDGTKARMRYAEMMYPNLDKFGDLQGEILTENYRAAISHDVCICGPAPTQTFSPRQTCHGFRYIEITGIDQPLPINNVKAIALSSLTDITAHYECSDTLINRLWNNILWSARDNFVSIPTDCPQRNERMGWSGDISVFSHTATYLSDVEEFLRRHLRALRDTQTPEGQFADVAPMKREGFGGFLWGSAGVTVPWQVYRQYGNAEVLREHYPAMARYIDYVERECIDPSTGLLVQNHGAWSDLGDWLSPEYDDNDRSLIWECYYIYDLDIMARVAAALGHDTEAEAYAKRRDERKAFFSRTYIDPETGRTRWSAYDAKREGQAVDTQTSYILPLAFGICQGAQRDAMAARLSQLIETDGYHLMVGFIGVPWIGEALTSIGRSDLLYRILACTEYPSWLYSVCQGATTIWERLNAYVEGEGFPAGNSMNSFNHYSFGSIGAWLIERSLGIKVDRAADGQTVYTIAPTPDSSRHLSYARGHYDSRSGRIESSWDVDADGMCHYRFMIPAGITATVALPGMEPMVCKEGTYEFSLPLTR